MRVIKVELSDGSDLIIEADLYHKIVGGRVRGGKPKPVLALANPSSKIHWVTAAEHAVLQVLREFPQGLSADDVHKLVSLPLSEASVRQKIYRLTADEPRPALVERVGKGYRYRLTALASTAVFQETGHPTRRYQPHPRQTEDPGVTWASTRLA